LSLRVMAIDAQAQMFPAFNRKDKRKKNTDRCSIKRLHTFREKWATEMTRKKSAREEKGSPFFRSSWGSVATGYAV